MLWVQVLVLMYEKVSLQEVKIDLFLRSGRLRLSF